MLTVATAYDALRTHLSRKPITPSAPSSARWRPYHARKVSSGITPDSTFSRLSEREVSLPTPEDAPNSQRSARKETRQQPASAVQDPEGLIAQSLGLLSSIYDAPRVSYQPSSVAAAGLPTPPASPEPRVHAQAIAPHVMHWFIVELLRRSHTPAAVIRAALAYITAAAPAIRAAIEDSETEPDCPLMDPRRVYLAAIILGSKFLLDRTYTNKTWAAVSGLDALEVGRCERTLGEVLQWRLWVGGPNSN